MAERVALREGVAERMGQVDSWTTAQLKGLLGSVGWPTLSVHGPEAAQAAWLLVQHADLDAAFQREALALLEPVVAAGDFPAKHHAYLVDRVAINEDRPQTYGTQGRCAEDGRWDPLPTREPEGVDARRAAVGLGSMAEYRDRFDCEGRRIAAMNQLKNGQHAACRDSFLALAETKRTPAGRASPLYNAACCASLAGDVEGGLSLLTRALSDGFSDRGLLETDADLANLRADPRWAEVIAR